VPSGLAPAQPAGYQFTAPLAGQAANSLPDPFLKKNWSDKRGWLIETTHLATL
jgi:hypothetical protein